MDRGLRSTRKSPPVQDTTPIAICRPTSKTKIGDLSQEPQQKIYINRRGYLAMDSILFSMMFGMDEDLYNGYGVNFGFITR